MSKKDISNKIPVDFNTFENPISNLDDDSLNPDAWIKPEMLRRVGEKGSNDFDDIILNNE